MTTGEHVLIVGGAGYIGSHVNKILSLKGYKTIVYDNLSSGYRENVKWGKLVLGDTDDRTQLDLLFRTYSIHTVMHFAAFIAVGESVANPAVYYRNNVVNTINLLDAMIAHQVPNIIFSSTAAVYGDPQYMPLDESHPLKPVNPYGWTKLIIEQILQDYKVYGLKHVILRYFNAAGADPDTEVGENHQPKPI